MIKRAARGMSDYLPSEMELREFVLRNIKDVYTRYGYSIISTPSVEHIDNLLSKQGNDNEKLVYKILKRGDKLNLNDIQSENELVDLGLRYDLTIPLTRYYSNNMSHVDSPFKSLQIGNVWRAERPQKGRLRQFMQCDIDIIGDKTNFAEIELISATATLLSKIGFEDFKIRLNDRSILKSMALSCGFDEADLNKVFVVVDKIDKIGFDGVKEELSSFCDMDCVNAYIRMLEDWDYRKTCKEFCNERCNGTVDSEISDNIDMIIDSVQSILKSGCDVIFDPTLVRGMGYYTGTVFEIDTNEFNSSIAGGGRYDEMIGRFTGKASIPACGFSLGFERIISILTEKKYELPKTKKTAYIFDPRISIDRFIELNKIADELREKGVTVLIVSRKKNIKFQKVTLEGKGFSEIIEF